MESRRDDTGAVSAPPAALQHPLRAQPQRRARIARHAQMHQRLRAGLETLGIQYIPKRSLHSLNCLQIPAGVDDAAVRRRLLEEWGIEIGSGLGPMAGKAWRIGLMGFGASVRNVDLVLAALRTILATR